MADITVQGNATADPELRFVGNGTQVLNFTVAENHRKKDQTGNWQDDGTTFYRVAVWGAQAESLAGSLGKGMRVLVSGRFRGGEFQGKDGLVKTYEVTANHVGLVPRGESQGGHQGYAQQGQQNYPQQGYPPQGQPQGAPQGQQWGGQQEAPF